LFYLQRQKFNVSFYPARSPQMLKVAYDPIYCHPLPEGHRFPMLKYELIPQQLLHEGVIDATNLFRPGLAREEHILRVHDQEYWNRMKNLQLTEHEMRKIGFPLTHELVTREMILVQGTIECALFAMMHGVSMNVAGGTHHAFTGRGEGFCLLNDVAVAAKYLLHHRLASRILIIDLDVHQGNGTAQIFAHEDRVFTFSIHGDKNYPFHKEHSDLDIALPDHTGDEMYLFLLAQQLEKLFPLVQPQMVFYISGVDVLATDKYGKLRLSQEACMKRDGLVMSACRQDKVPLTIAMGGGYSPRISDIVNAHCNTFKAAQNFFFN
jgi:acetoin utilization deacetylase AcuC-like enzyme